MPLAQERWIEVGGINTRYFDEGEGETILLLHGSFFGECFSADHSANWSKNFKGLSRSHRVIAMDRLGQGLTDNPKSPDQYTMSAVGRHVKGFLQKLNVGPIHVVGHSRGGYVACRLTLDYPDLVKTCVIVDSGTLAPGATPMHEIMADAPKPLLTRESQEWVLRRYSYGFDHIDDEWLDALADVAGSDKYKQAREIVEASDYAEDLKREKELTYEALAERGLGKPILVLWSLNDPTAVIERGHVLFKAIAEREPRAQMHIFNKSGHFPYREHPEQFNRLLKYWVELNA